MKRRIVLTGASGFLGQHLLSSFLFSPSHFEIFVLFGGSSDKEEFMHAIQSIETPVTTHLQALDLSDAAAAKQWVEAQAPPLDLCLHLAALSSPRLCEEHPERAHATNNPTAFLEALAVARVPTVILSTDQVYDGTTEALYRETDATHPVNTYGQTKVALEHSLAEIFTKHSIPHVSLRSSIILGPRAPLSEAHDTFLHFCEKRGREQQETTFYTDEIRNVVSVQNVVSVLLYFCRQGISPAACGVYNMGGKDQASRYDMAQAVCAHFGYKTDILIAAEKANLPPSGVASPLDISMDSTKLETLTGVQFKGLQDIVKDTFSA